MNELTNRMIHGDMPPEIDTLVANALHEEVYPVKRKSYTALIVAAVLLFALACTAVAAISLQRSPQYEATQIAQGELASKYGIQPESIPLFMENTEEGDEGWTVTYKPYSFADRIGTYEVAVGRDGTAQASWSHDGADLAELKDAGMNINVWGQAQLAELRELKLAYQAKELEMIQQLGNPSDWSIEAWAELDSMLVDTGYYGQEHTLHVLPAEGDITEDEALERMREAIGSQYGVPAQMLDAYDVALSFVQQPGRETPSYEIYLMGRVAGTEGITYTLASSWVSIDARSGEVLNLGYHGAEGLILPSGPLNEQEEAVRDYVQSGTFALLEDDTLRAEAAARITEAGLGELIDNITYGIPSADAIDRTQAAELGTQALQEVYGLTSDMIALLTIRPAYVLTGEGDHWVVTLLPDDNNFLVSMYREKVGTYTATLDALSGEVIGTAWSHDGTVLDAPSTEKTWGAAPAWDAQALTWLMELSSKAEDLGMAHMQSGKMPEPAEHAFRYDMPEYDALFRDAGFIESIYSSTNPTENQVSWADAVLLAEEALRADFGLSDEALQALTFAGGFSIRDAQVPVWSFTVYYADGSSQESYYITLDGTSGELIEVLHYIEGKG